MRYLSRHSGGLIRKLRGPPAASDLLNHLQVLQILRFQHLLFFVILELPSRTLSPFRLKQYTKHHLFTFDINSSLSSYREEQIGLLFEFFQFSLFPLFQLRRLFSEIRLQDSASLFVLIDRVDLDRADLTPRPTIHPNQSLKVKKTPKRPQKTPL